MLKFQMGLVLLFHRLRCPHLLRFYTGYDDNAGGPYG